jgi:pilus assembly protein CpaF
MPPLGGNARPTTSSIPAPPHSPFPPAAIAPARRAIPPAAAPLDRPGSEPGTGPPGAHRTALAALIERVGESVDLDALASGAQPDANITARITAAINERAAAMKIAGQIPDGVTHEALAADARRELLELGPLGPLLVDDDVTEIQLLRHDHLIAFRKSRKHATAEISFTSEESVSRVLRRLCRSTGAPLVDGETVIERRLPEGPRLLALLPPASAKGHLVVLRKPQRAEPSTLEDLVRSGALSRGIATLLLHCMAGRANVLVVGPQGSGSSSLVAALAATFGGDERVVLLQDDEDLTLNHPHALPLQVGAGSSDTSALVRAAARMRPDRLVVAGMSGAITAEVVDAISEGVSGIVAASRAPTLRHAAARLTSDLTAARPAAGAPAAREAIASAFDLLIEIARLRDGRQRILRVAELRVEDGALAPRDIFTFTVERTAAGGAIEGSFHPTGVVPAIVEDLAARGSPLDASLFRRPGK